MKKKWEAIRIGVCWITALAKDIPKLIPGSFEWYFTWQKKKKTVQAWLRILRWWDYPGLSKYNHIYFIRQKEIWHRQKKVNWPQRQRLEGCSHKPINPGGPQKLEEVRHAFSPGTSRGRTALPTPYFSPALLIWDFWPLWL